MRVGGANGKKIFPRADVITTQVTTFLSRVLISSNFPELFYDPVSENTALSVYSLGADAAWEGGPLKRSYKILKEV